MTWKEQLGRVVFADGRRLIGASFRGAPFFVQSSDRGGGRRAPVSEFPTRNDPFVDDLGRRGRTFRVEGHVIGDDYIVARNALITALEDVTGPGELRHPYHGTRRCVCSTFTVRETISDGGMAFFSIEFSEAPLQSVSPSSTPDFIEIVSRSADVANDGTAEDFEAAYAVDDEPGFAIEGLTSAFTAVAEGVGAELARLNATTQELALLDVEIKSLVSQASSIVRTPANVVSSLAGALATVSETAAGAPKSFARALIAAYRGYVPGVVQFQATQTRINEAANLVALETALLSTLAIEAARALPLIEFDTIDDAVADRNAVADILEEQAESAGDVAYLALVELRSDVVLAVPEQGLVARLVTLDQRVAIPSLLLAYNLYGDVSREPEIVARNSPQHPAFMLGSLEVIAADD
jgi:prophage DNA circulation protein